MNNNKLKYQENKIYGFVHILKIYFKGGGDNRYVDFKCERCGTLRTVTYHQLRAIKGRCVCDNAKRTQGHNIRNGQRFGWLTINKEIERLNNMRRFECTCDCGKTVNVYLCNLTSGQTKSCGCFRRHNYDGYHHPEWKEPLYVYYHKNLTSMCKRNNAFNDFKGYINFKEWALNNGYKDGLVLYRKDIERPYSDENCYWTKHGCDETIKINKNTVFVEYNKKRIRLIDFCNAHNIDRTRVYGYIKNGYTIDEILSKLKQ